MDRNEIVLMYSGGLDTTYMAIQLAKEFQKVHLLTFCNGVCINPEASRYMSRFCEIDLVRTNSSTE